MKKLSLLSRLVVGLGVASIPAMAGAQVYPDFWGSNFQNLLGNGGFETNTSTVGRLTLTTTQSSLSTWQVKSGGVDLYRKAWFKTPNMQPAGTSLASQGLQSYLLELNGVNAGRIGQDVNLVAGKNYILQFWMSANAGSAGATLVNPPIKTMDVRLGGSTISSQAYDVTGLNNQTALWYKKSVTFTASTTGATALDFASTNFGQNGMFIDNATLVMVPEPATGLLALVGAAPLAWVIRRRRLATA